MRRVHIGLLVIGLLSVAVLSCAADAPTVSGIGPTGGTVILRDGAVQVTFPSGALTTNTQVGAASPASFPASPLLLSATVIEISPAQLELARQISLRMSFASIPLPEGIRSEELRIFQLISGFWIELGGVVNVSDGFVQFDALESLGTFALMAVPVQSVIVVPTSITRSIGETAQLVAVARDAAGNTLPDRSIEWSSGSSSIVSVSSTGLLSALSAGVTQVVARGREGLPGSVSATVTAPPTSVYPNEPPGFIRFLEHSLNVLPSGTNGSFGSWYNNGGPRFSIVNEASAPQSASSVANVIYPAGWDGGFPPAQFGHESETQRGAMYFSMRMRILGSDYENHPVFTKIGFFGYGRVPSGAYNEGFWVLKSPTSSRIQSSLLLEFRQQNHVTRNFDQNVVSTPLFTVGPWHQIELLAELNTINVANGKVKIWLDGVLILSYSDVVFRNTANPAGFRSWKFDPTYGGIANPKSRQDIWQVDHVYVSGTPLP